MSDRRQSPKIAVVLGLAIALLGSPSAEARRDNFNENARNNANGNGIANANCNSALILVCDDADGAPAALPGTISLGGLLGSALVLGTAAGWRRRRSA